MGGASEISPQPRGSGNSGATHLATEACPHSQGQGGGGVRAAGLPGAPRSHRGPPTCPPPLAGRAGGRPFGAAGNWQTSCRSDLRLSRSPRPGSPARNNMASSPASPHTPRGARGAGLRSRGRAAEPSGPRGTGRAPLARRVVSPRGGSGPAGRAPQHILRPVPDGSGGACGVGGPREGPSAPCGGAIAGRRPPGGRRRLDEK